MADDPKTPDPRQEILDRTAHHRRWAYALMLALSTLLTATLLLRTSQPWYADPQFFKSGEALVLAADEMLAAPDGATSRHHTLTETLSVVRTEHFSTSHVQIVSQGDRLMLLSGRHGSIQREGRTERTFALAIEWDVAHARADGDRIVLHGLTAPEGEPTKTRRLMRATVPAAALWEATPGSKVPVDGAVELVPALPEHVTRLAALRAGDQEVVAWMDYAARKTTVRRLDGAGAAIEDVDRFALAADGEDVLVLTSRWRLEEIGVLRLETHRFTPGGALETAGDVRFDDPRVMGRRVTGLALHPDGDGWVLAIARTTSVQVARIRRDGDGLAPVGDPLPVTGQPIWSQALATVLTPVLLACSISLIYFGVAIYREKRRMFARILKVRRFISPYAGVVERGFAYVIDVLLLMPVAMLGWDYLGVNLQAAGEEAVAWNAAAFSLTLLGVQFVYFFLMELIWGQTVGKLILGIRVQAVGGGRAGFWSVLLRNAVRALEGTTLTWAIGLAFIMFTPKRQRLGDLLGRTVVVPVAKERELDEAAEAGESKGEAKAKAADEAAP